MGERRTLGTIWEVPDELWAEIEDVLRELDPPKPTGRPRMDQRTALNGMIHRLRSGCQWNHLPERFGSDSSVHRTFQRWVSKGVFRAVWALLIVRCGELGGVEWEWQSADGSMNKARSGGTKSAQTRQTVARPGARRASSWMALAAR
jgi:putative transposase